MVTKVSRWGKSLGIRIPKSIAERLGIKEGTELNIYVD
ncbi:AbrB/MazE/SpoVT family DNA-binding domain-containing protein [Psychrobacillus lasiicapitis]|nr:AbrB/MazE/SpoVT family DNA-binding domain-containing protein [Psychrobacillus lasiicapitis]